MNESFKCVVKEEETRIERREHWEAEIDGYEVYFLCRPDESEHLTIYQRFAGLRMGIIECSPENVAALRRFAADAHSLLNKIADGLEANGR